MKTVLAVFVLTIFFYAVYYFIPFVVIESLRKHTNYIENMTLWYNIARIICLIVAIITSLIILF